MNVLALVPALPNTSPGQRFRIEQWAPYLKRDGVDITFAPFEDAALHDVLYQPGHTLKKVRLVVAGLWRRFRLARQARKFDLVYLFREAAILGPALVERLIARRVPVVFDFDDAIWVPYISPANRSWSRLKCFGKTATLCRISAHVMTGNPYLADYARRFNSNVTVIPTTIDTTAYQPRTAAAAAEPLTIGWTGSYSTVQHLDILRPALTELRRDTPYRLAVVGTPQYAIDGVEVDARQWNAASEVADLQRFDVGIMPVPDDDWSQGKCGLKLLQCMALGIPVIGSPVGVNRDIIQDGVNGFLAGTQAEWVERLGRLIADPALRREMGLRGRKTVEERYSGELWAPRVRAVFESVLPKPGAALTDDREAKPAHV